MNKKLVLGLFYHDNMLIAHSRVKGRFYHVCKWCLLLIFILLLWSFYSAAGEVWGDRTEWQKIISTIKMRLIILPTVLFFLVFQESLTMLPGLQPTTWFAAKSSKFAKFASGTPVGFEDQPVYWTQSSKQNLQQQNISIRHLKTRPAQPGIKSKSCSAIHKKWFQQKRTKQGM